MENQLTQQDLLDRLYSFYHSWHLHGVTRLQGKGEQAYAQLVEIVKEHFGTPDGKVECPLCGAYYDDSKIWQEQRGQFDPVENHKTDTQEGVEEASDFKLAKSRLKAILDNLIDSGYSQADALKDILYVIQDIIRTKRVDEIAKSIAIQMTAENFCPECGTEFLSCCKQLLSRQPQKRVTREWIRRYDRSDGMDREEMLKELGFVVEK